MASLVCGVRLRGCLGGFGLVCARAPHSSGRPFFQGTLSAGDVTRDTPHGSAYCKRPNGQRVGSPAGQQPSSWERVVVVGWCRLRLPLSCLPLGRPPLGTARLSSLRLVSAGPRAPAGTHPFGHSPVFPHFRTKTCLYR